MPTTTSNNIPNKTGTAFRQERFHTYTTNNNQQQQTIRMQDPSSRYFGGVHRVHRDNADADADDSSLEESHEYNYNEYNNSNNNTSRDQGTAEYLREDHLEDFDSQRPDYKSTTGEAATATMTANTAARDRIDTATGMSLFDNLNQSIDSRDMEDLVDNYTFDGSTITSNIDSKHYRHKYNDNENAQAAIIDWGSLPASQRRQAPQLQQQQQRQAVKPSHSNDPTIDSGSYSNDSRKSKSSRAAAVCCGMGKLTLALILLTVLVCSIAIILYLVLVFFDNDSSNSAAAGIAGSNNANSNNGFASPCCSGTFFNRDMLGKEICREQINGPDICCVVCDKNMASVENELENDNNENNNGENENNNSDSNNNDQSTTTAMTSSPAPTYIRTQAPSATPTIATTTMEPTATPSLRATAATTTSTTATNSPTSTLVYADSGNVCCPDRKWADYEGRIRCMEVELTDGEWDPTSSENCPTCEVCPISDNGSNGESESATTTTASPTTSPTTSSNNNNGNNVGGISFAIDNRKPNNNNNNNNNNNSGGLSGNFILD